MTFVTAYLKPGLDFNLQAARRSARWSGNQTRVLALSEARISAANRHQPVSHQSPEPSISIPTPDHYLPMLYVMATRQEREAVTFPIEGVDGGSISMLTVQVG
jgi:aromatic ring-opening dioxygenase catalytic subunit (LigB family)